MSTARVIPDHRGKSEPQASLDDVQSHQTKDGVYSAGDCEAAVDRLALYTLALSTGH